MFNVRTFYFAFSVICCVHHYNGYETSAKSLELYPPWLVTYRYVNENYRVVCRCYETYHEIKWIKLNEGPVRENGKKMHTQAIQKGIALVFTNITKEVEGDYQCVAFDKNRNIRYTNQFTLNVEEPIIFDSPTVYEAVLDETVLLDCEVNEKLALKRHWEFKGNILPSVERYQYLSEGIQISEVGLGDAGKYYCVISHWPFQSTSNILQITLIVYYKPVPRSDSNSVTYGFVDEVVSITCEVSANPNPWFIWYNKNRIPLDPKNHKVNITVQNDTSVLKVLLTESMKETVYICEACNELGCAEQIIQVKKTTKLRTPVLGLWDIDSDSAEFYVSTQDEASLYIFQYFFDVDEDIQWETPFEQNFSTVLPRAKMDSYVRYEVDKLHPDTNYILRVASANQYTKSEFSEERRFKTRVGRTIHTICNVCSSLRNCSVLMLLPFINVITFKNIFH